MSREAHVRICERLGSVDPGRLDCVLVFRPNILYQMLWDI